MRVSTETMRRRINDGSVPAARIGSAYRVRRADLDALYASPTSPTKGDA